MTRPNYFERQIAGEGSIFDMVRDAGGFIKGEHEEVARATKKRQDECTHRATVGSRLTGSGGWSIGLQHNFPDRCPRGICLRCGLVIYPNHWTCAGPNEVKVVTAHPLYGVVIQLDYRDHELAVLEQKHTQQIDAVMWSDSRLIPSSDAEYRRQCAQIIDDCEKNTAKFIKPTEEPKRDLL